MTGMRPSGTALGTSGAASALPDPPGRDLSAGAEIVAAAVALGVGALARLAPVVTAGFPLNDGGLFLAMADDVRRTGSLIPATTSYNGLGIPFAYPPLALDLTGIAMGLTGSDGLWILRFVPAIVSLATIPAVYLLGRAILPSRFHAFVAALMFAFVPRSFEWLVMGGGITRAPGFLFATLAILAAVVVARRASAPAALAAGVCVGLTGLTHPQALVFALVSMAIVTGAYARSRRAVGLAAGAVAVGAAIIFPWVVVIVATHGPGPLLSAASSGANPVDSILYLTSLALTDESFWRIVTPLGLVGFLFELSRRRWVVPAWTAALVLADPRSAANFTMVPLSFLAAIGFVDVLVERLFAGSLPFDARSVWPASVVRRRGFEALFAALLVLGIVTGSFAVVSPGYVAAVPASTRDAITWARANTPPQATFLVVSGRDWFDDATAEWFPTLALRQSVGTVQGYEWLGRDEWLAQEDASEELAACARRTVSCVDAWMSAHRPADYVFIPKGRVAGPAGPDDCCVPLRETIRLAPGFTVVYDGPGATIARVIAGAGAIPIRPDPRASAHAGRPGQAWGPRVWRPGQAWRPRAPTVLSSRP